MDGWTYWRLTDAPAGTNLFAFWYPDERGQRIIHRVEVVVMDNPKLKKKRGEPTARLAPLVSKEWSTMVVGAAVEPARAKLRSLPGGYSSSDGHTEWIGKMRGADGRVVQARITMYDSKHRITDVDIDLLPD